MALFGTSFLLLFIFEGPPKDKFFFVNPASYFIPSDLLIDDSWYKIDFNNNFIGYCHCLIKRDITKKNRGGYILQNKLFLRIPMLGELEKFNLDTKVNLTKNYSLCNAQINFSTGKYFFKGRIEKEKNKRFKLIITTPAQTSTQYINTSYKFISSSFMPLLSNYLPLNKKTKIMLFDPFINREITAYLENKGHKIITFNNKETEVIEMSLNVEGMEGKIYTDIKGHLLRQEMLGFKFTKIAPSELFKKSFSIASIDFINNFTVSVETIPEKEKIKKLTLKIEGVDLKNIPQKYNQQVDKNFSTVTLSRVVPKKISSLPVDEKIFFSYLKEDRFIKFRSTDIEKIAKRIVGKETDPFKIIKLFNDWINENIRRIPTISIPNSLDTLKLRQGDCGELSALLVGFLRSVGIPSYVNIGLVYKDGRFFYHAWVSAFVGEWIDTDPALSQLIADVTHLALRKSLEGQFEIFEFIGKIKIKVLNYTYIEND